MLNNTTIFIGNKQQYPNPLAVVNEHVFQSSSESALQTNYSLNLNTVTLNVSYNKISRIYYIHNLFSFTIYFHLHTH